jgi:hypothetical protein
MIEQLTNPININIEGVGVFLDKELHTIFYC